MVNFSKSTWGTVKTIPEGDIFKFNYQFKGRIIQAGLCGTACVTEYAPHHSLLFTSEELLEFNTKEQCVRILKDLLNDSKKLLSYTEKLENKVKNFYEEEKSFKSIYNTINRPNIKKENLQH